MSSDLKFSLFTTIVVLALIVAGWPDGCAALIYAEENLLPPVYLFVTSQAKSFAILLTSFL